MLGQDFASLAHGNYRVDLPHVLNVLFMSEKSISRKKKTVHSIEKISTSCTTQECDDVTTSIDCPISALLFCTMVAY